MNNVILIGFMGCGKSTIGFRLSYKLRRVLEDTDKLIEKKEGMSVSDIFATKGEAAFRVMETECLRGLLLSQEEKIIATGGGLPVKEENHALLKELGAVVYLRISPKGVWERLKDDTTRPLLQCDNPIMRIEELMAERASVYEACADMIVDVDEKDVEQVVAELLERVAEREERCQSHRSGQEAEK
ncbi:MAG: shikimate kinase [Lachnospiraceae bacterium]|nr:shikimate kinase [Lachnospiraceae bacterium]